MIINDKIYGKTEIKEPVLPRITLEDAMQSIIFFLIESIMMYILYIRPKLKQSPAV